jgi:hypothetical protein
VGTLVWSLKLEGSGSCDLDINWNPFGGTGTRTGLWNSHFVRTKIRIGTLIKKYTLNIGLGSLGKLKQNIFQKLTS